MAEPTGTAREEAERLVATVLAMASRSGLGGPPREPGGSDDARPGRGLADAAAAATDMISGLVGQFLGGDPASTPRGSGSRTADDRAAASRDASGDAGTDKSGSQSDRQAPESAESGSGGTSAGAAGQAGDARTGWGGGARHGAGAGRDSRSGGFGVGWQDVGQQLWQGLGKRSGWATGSVECCVCPVCRAIAGMRDPGPERAERLATGAGDFATGVASLLRAVSVVTGTSGTSARRKPPARPATTPDQAWSAATRRAKPADPVPPAHEVREGDDPWTAATRAPRPAEATAKEQAAAQSDVDATTPAEPAPDETTAWVVTTGGSVSGPAPDASEPSAAVTDAGAQRDPWAAATRAPKPPTRKPSAPAPAARPAGKTGAVRKTAGDGPGRPRLAGNDAGVSRRVTGATDVWAAATAANGDTDGDTGVADTRSVDHDVPGSAPAGSPAEGRGAGTGDDARAGDAV